MLTITYSQVCRMQGPVLCEAAEKVPCFCNSAYTYAYL